MAATASTRGVPTPRSFDPFAGDDGPPAKPVTDEGFYVFSPSGLYPRAVAQDTDVSGVPPRTLQLFTFMGRFVAKALLASQDDYRNGGSEMSTAAHTPSIGFAAGGTTDGGTGGIGSTGGDAGADSDEGCGCNTAPGSGGGSGLAALLLGGLFLRRRRR